MPGTEWPERRSVTGLNYPRMLPVWLLICFLRLQIRLQAGAGRI